eukprot:5657559-Prymnesium_polylepis.1
MHRSACFVTVDRVLRSYVGLQYARTRASCDCMRLIEFGVLLGSQISLLFLVPPLGAQTRLADAGI